MEAYCARRSVQMDQTRFLFYGIECHETQTPAELDMEDGDVIDCVVVHDCVVVRLFGEGARMQRRHVQHVT